MSRLAKILPVIYFLLDMATIAIIFYATQYFFGSSSNSEKTILVLVVNMTVWLMLGLATKLYSANLHNGISLRIKSYIKNYMLFIVITILIQLILFGFPLDQAFSLYFLATFTIANLLLNVFVIGIISKFRRRTDNIKYTLITGVGTSALNISAYFNANPDYGFQIVGYFRYKNESGKVPEEKILGSLKNLGQYLNDNIINEVVIAFPYKFSKEKKIKKIIGAADFHGARISYVPDYKSLFGKNYKIVNDQDFNAVSVRQLPLDELFSIIAKGVFDIVFSFFVLVLFSPLFILIGIIIKLDTPGPILYCPERVGRSGRNFTLYKFRTMRKNDIISGGKFSTKKNDPRITKVGRFLRRFNIDELPQFINVFLGDMSVVGPRPHRNFLNDQMKEHVKKYMLRHYFRPGITGWAQVNGWRGPTETPEQITQRTNHDLWYIENWSFALDIKIVWMTIFSKKAFRNAF